MSVPHEYNFRRWPHGSESDTYERESGHVLTEKGIFYEHYKSCYGTQKIFLSLDGYSSTENIHSVCITGC